MNNKCLLYVISLLITMVFISAVLTKERDVSLKNSRYMATCSLCKCLCEVSGQEVYLMRDQRQRVCFICAKCKKARPDLK